MMVDVLSNIVFNNIEEELNKYTRINVKQQKKTIEYIYTEIIMLSTGTNTLLSVTRPLVLGHFTIGVNSSQEQWFKLNSTTTATKNFVKIDKF